MITNSKKTLFKPEEDNYIIKLRNKGKSIKEIHILFNEHFKVNRTFGSIESRIQKLLKSSYNKNIDTIIVKFCRLYPTNLQFAFKKAAIELNKNNKTFVKYTKNQISGRYYSFIRKHYSIVSTCSKEGFVLNVKNSISTKKRNQPKLTPVLFLLKEILELDEKERLNLIDFLNKTNN